MQEKHQLSLGLGIESSTSFDNFFCAQTNKLLLNTLRQCILSGENDFIYFSGQAGSGKTHLLLASLALAQSVKSSVFYLPLQEMMQFPAKQVLDQHMDSDFLLIDDIEAAARAYDWQQALFDTYNQRNEAGKAIFIASQVPANQLRFELADLNTRLSACLSFQLRQLDEPELPQYIQFLAEQKAMPLSEACAHFILQRAGRSIAALKYVIDELDKAQILHGKKITIPFIKSLFDW
ncbi:MAG: DnaA regulatory inactivator Hda [Pseudomonadales bacterium]|nr:DnaA regulatory inactivator Hda [Pseudomonadales bacterium]